MRQIRWVYVNRWFSTSENATLHFKKQEHGAGSDQVVLPRLDERNGGGTVGCHFSQPGDGQVGTGFFNTPAWDFVACGSWASSRTFVGLYMGKRSDSAFSWKFERN